MAQQHLNGLVMFGRYKRSVEIERVSKAGQPYKQRMYVLNVRFTTDKQDDFFINLSKDGDFANLREGEVYGFPVIHREPYKAGAKSTFVARDDAAPFPAPMMETLL